MNLTFSRTYRSKGLNNPASKGKLRFSYVVTGTKEDLAKFKKAQGDFYLENEKGQPIMNLLHNVGKSTDLVETQDGRFIPNTSVLDQASDLAQQYPFLASAIAEKVLGNLFSGTSATPVASVVASAPADLGK